ncbi:rod shape determining protein RodA [Barrientosiimonas humi]|uniref:peptidoglycan glycosyltransferase n=2 Tax=Barrientosiimonas TaxID=1535207 RepID=A0A542XCU7_9MICO|nr:rod shape-determining protein RodA [Barrientosiimonas humi]TQL33637.1 rod shape determining protein RodA [Barrientosiimonas humi]CAG7573624.1 Rod shape-determining protein RodA [Barrientosiimonas humi]
MTLARTGTEARRQLSWTRTDWGLVVAALGLSLVGAMLVWSATRGTSGNSYLVRHLLNTAVGVGLGLAVMRIDFRTIRAWAPWVYLASLLGLVAVLSPLGSTINGSRSWVQLPGFSIQPAELAKVALCIGLAMILAERGERDHPPPQRDVALAVGLAAVPILLVLAQPDLGSAVVLVMISLGVVAVSGASRWWLVGAAVGMVAAVVAAWTTPLLSDYQRDRLLAFADPTIDPQGIGYQVSQVRLAIGSGGWWGQGVGEGTQTQGGFIPFQQTDFVFSVAGEELGFAGAAGLLLVSGFVVLRAFLIARDAQDSFGRLVATGVGCWLLFQTVQNVGMNLGMLPVTGLPLPFVSYGGSSMFACWVAVGLLGNVHLVNLRKLF